MKIRTTLLAAAALMPVAAAQTQLLNVLGPTANTSFGSALGSCDVNGDGAKDVLVGDWQNAMGKPDGGMFRVYSGYDGEMLIAQYATAAGQHLGWAVTGLGDINLDGRDDFAVGAPGDDTTGADAGAVFVYSGYNGSKLFSFFGATAGDGFGYSVSNAGDINADGRADLVVGAPSGTVVNVVPVKAGLVRVYSGANGALLLNLKGASVDDQFGYSVDGAGDFDGDGRDDLVIGVRGYGTGFLDGRAEVRSGLDGHVIWSKNGTTEMYGDAVSGVGDVNADGLADVAIGAPFKNLWLGHVEIRLGPSGTLWTDLTGESTDDGFGECVDGAGDVNKDGYADFVVGAPMSDSGRGYVRVYSGRNGTLLYGTVYGDAQHDSFGSAVCGLGDANLDGWQDIVTGAPQQAGNGYLRTFDWLTVAPDLGKGGPGNAKLKMYGAPLTSEGQMDLSLKGAAGNKPAMVFASVAQANLAFKGGTLVPALGNALMVAVVTSPQGTLKFTGIPGGNGPVSLYLQVLIQDPAQAKGWAFSNAIKPQFLP